LDETARERYQALAILLEDMPVHPVMQRALWQVDEATAEETAEQFVSLCLAQREHASIRLHDLQLDYVRAQYADRSALKLIHGAVRLSAHAIIQDPFQFASQLVGRLLAYREYTPIRQFTDLLAEGAPRPWLRPLHPALHPAGT